MTTYRSAQYPLLALLSGAALALAADPQSLTAQEATDAAAEPQMRIMVFGGRGGSGLLLVRRGMR